MKLIQRLSLFLLLPVSCMASEAEKYDMGPLRFEFNESRDIYLNGDQYRIDSFWGMYYQIDSVMYILEHLLPPDELLLIESGVMIKMLPYIDEAPSESESVKLSFIKGESSPLADILSAPNLGQVEKTFGAINRKLLEDSIKSHIITEDWHDSHELYYLYIKVPKDYPESIYTKAFVYIMDEYNNCVNTYINHPELLQMDNIGEEISPDMPITIQLEALLMLIRASIEPDLFTQEDKQIVFYPIRSLKEKEMKGLLEKLHPYALIRQRWRVIWPDYNEYLTDWKNVITKLSYLEFTEALLEMVEDYPQHAVFRKKWRVVWSGYSCPMAWKDTITKMSYPQFIQSLLDELDSVFPERKSDIRQ